MTASIQNDERTQSQIQGALQVANKSLEVSTQALSEGRVNTQHITYLHNNQRTSQHNQHQQGLANVAYDFMLERLVAAIGGEERLLNDGSFE